MPKLSKEECIARYTANINLLIGDAKRSRAEDHGGHPPASELAELERRRKRLITRMLAEMEHWPYHGRDYIWVFEQEEDWPMSCVHRNKRHITDDIYQCMDCGGQFKYGEGE